MLKLLTHNKVIFDFNFNYYNSGLWVYCEQIIEKLQSAEDIIQGILILWMKYNHFKVTSPLKSLSFFRGGLHPVSANRYGGRKVRTDPGNV